MSPESQLLISVVTPVYNAEPGVGIRPAIFRVGQVGKECWETVGEPPAADGGWRALCCSEN